MNKSISAVAVLICLLSGLGSARAQAYFSEVYQYNPYFFNGGFAGSEGQKFFSFVQVQNIGFDKNHHVNTMTTLGYEADLTKINSGIAVTGFSRLLGPQSETNISGTYNYRFTLGKELRIIPAFNIRSRFVSVDTRYYRPIQPDDPIMEVGSSRTSYLEADLSLLLRYKRVFLGGHISNLLSSSESTDEIFGSSYEQNNILMGADININELFSTRHLFLAAWSSDGELYDVSNTIVYKKLLLLGLSARIYDDKITPRASTGVTIKDYFTIAVNFYTKPEGGSENWPMQYEGYVQFKF